MAQPQPPATATVIINAGHVIVEPGKPVLHQQTITIEGGKFAAVEAGFSDSPDAIDLKNAWLMPGLIDMHTHVTILITDRTAPPATAVVMASIERQSKTVLAALRNAQVMLASGFTTLRNVGDPSGVLYDLRDAINSGQVAGPRIFGTQSQIVVSGGDYDPVAFGGIDEAAFVMFDTDGVCSGVDDCRSAVRREIRRGADVIKIRISGAGTLGPEAMYESREELASIIETAHGLGRTVAVHSHSQKGSEMALKLGANTIEHGLPSADHYSLFPYANGEDIFFVPTLTAFEAVREMLVEMTGVDMYAVATKEIAAAYKAGVPIAFGTDAGAFPHGQAAREFALMADVGISNVDILKSTTVNAARALKKFDQLGSIAPGKWGDVVATAENPLEDISQMEKVIFVMKAGHDYTNILSN